MPAHSTHQVVLRQRAVVHAPLQVRHLVAADAHGGGAVAAPEAAKHGGHLIARRPRPLAAGAAAVGAAHRLGDAVPQEQQLRGGLQAEEGEGEG